MHMGKIKFAKHPRSIVRKHQDHPSSLFVTVPAKIVKQWQLKSGEILEFIFATEDFESYVKIKKVSV
jgi:hypothetical protein